MGLYKGRLWPLLLAALLGVGVVACDSSSADDEESEESEEASDDEDSDDEESEEGDASAAEDSDLPFYATGPVATVDGVELEPEGFNEMVRERVEQMPGGVQPQMVDQFKQQSINFAIDKQLIDQVLEEEQIEVTEDDVREAIEEFKSRFPDEATFEQTLEEMGMSEEEMMEGIEKDVQLEKYLSESHDLSVSEDEIRQFFEEHEEQFSRDDEIHARHILIEADEGADDEAAETARERAEEIYEEVTGGADFEEMAREHSEGPTGPRGGDLGFFPEDRMVPEFSEVAFSMEPGEISEPVRTQFGYHVIEVVDTRDASEPDFDEEASEIEMHLSQQKRAEVFHQFLEELKADVDIEILEENIEVTVDTSQAPQQGMPQMPHGGDGQAPQLQLGE